jgi:uncharacterized protein YvpB
MAVVGCLLLSAVLWFVTVRYILSGGQSSIPFASAQDIANQVTGVANAYNYPGNTYQNQQIANTATPRPTPTPTPASSPVTLGTEAPVPATALLDVPFTSQAPFANWDALHEDACEEASLMMVSHYIGKTTWATTAQADQEITNLVNYGASVLGHPKSITMYQLSGLARAYYGTNADAVQANANLSRLKNGVIMPVNSVDDIKREIASGRPVIVPTAGKLLNNPNFKNGGPVYHNLVIIGYDGKNFITNDPGIRQGKHYLYPYDVLLNAIHDWNAVNILDGAKVMLVFD